MPGNPLPISTKNLEESGWPFEESIGWGSPNITPSPKAIFSSSDPSETLAKTNGYVKFTTGSEMPNEEIPDTDGERGFKITYGARPNAFSDNEYPELNMELLIPQHRFFEKIRIYQPTNYKTRRLMEFDVGDSSNVSGWEKGDVITTSAGGYGIIYQIGGGDAGHPNSTYPVVLDNYSGGHPNQAWTDGIIVTNTTKSLSVTSQGGYILQKNNKFSIWWVKKEGAKNGYSNGALNFETDAAGDTSGNAIIKLTAEGSSYTSAGQSGTLLNEIEGAPSRPVLFDVDNNGSFIQLWLERKRSTEHNKSSGEFRAWIKTEREGSDYPEWTLLFENTGIGYGTWTEPEDNKFGFGYLFGWADSGYEEETVFYLTDYELWLGKPDELVLAGV